MKDATLGGYLREHERPPAFAGPDGSYYTVEILVDAQEGEADGYGGYLFFLCWQGQEPVGHVETGYLVEASGEDEARAELEAMTLHQVKAVLDELVRG